MRPHLSILVPAYNEEDRLGPSLSSIAGYLKQQRIDAEVIVVDDGSTDGTAAVAQEGLTGIRGTVLQNGENRGKGYSFRRGFEAAIGRWVLLTDADLSTPIEDHAKLAAVARDHDVDIVIGSRALPDSVLPQRQNFVRESMGKTFNRIIRVSMGLPFRDTQCGFKLFDRHRTADLISNMMIDGFAFDVEILFVARRFGLSMREVAVTWSNDPRSTVGLVSDPLRMLADLARVRWRFRRGMYNPVAQQDTADARERQPTKP